MVGETVSDRSVGGSQDGSQDDVGASDSGGSEVGGCSPPDATWQRWARLPDRAENEIMRLRYLSLKGKVRECEARNAVLEGMVVSRKRKGRVDVGRECSRRPTGKRRRSNEDIWFTTLAEVEVAERQESVGAGQKEKVDMEWRGEEDNFFWDVLKEVDGG